MLQLLCLKAFNIVKLLTFRDLDQLSQPMVVLSVNFLHQCRLARLDLLKLGPVTGAHLPTKFQHLIIVGVGSLGCIPQPSKVSLLPEQHEEAESVVDTIVLVALDDPLQALHCKGLLEQLLALQR